MWTTAYCVRYSRGVSDAEPRSDAGLPARVVTLNQLVGYNMRWFRQAAGITQEELGRRLGGWSKVVVSAAERSWDGQRVRKFDADEMTRIASALGIPVIALLLPPVDADTAVDYDFDVGANGLIAMEEVLRVVLPEYQGGTPASDAFIGRVIQLGADWFIRQGDDFVLEARRAVEETLSETGAQSLKGEIPLLLEPIVQARKDLQRRVTDLRAFEREYRLRLIKYHDEALRELLAGVEDPDTLPAGEAPPEDRPAKGGDQ